MATPTLACRAPCSHLTAAASWLRVVTVSQSGHAICCDCRTTVACLCEAGDG